MKERTEHAQAERATWDELHAQMSLLQSNSALQAEVQSIHQAVMLLNTQRQIVYVNTTCLDMFKVTDPAELYACRPGEALQCVHAEKGEGGCGTSKYCKVCGAANAVLNSLQGKVDVQRCTIQTTTTSAPLELVTFTMPLHLNGQRFVLVSLLNHAASVADSSTLANHAFTLQRLAAKIEQAA